MKTDVLPITAVALGSLALVVSASGQFINVTIDEIDLGAPEGFVTYRVVAHFAGPDLLLAWGAIPGVARLHFFTYNSVDLLNAGGGFDGLKFEDFAAFPIAEEYDSYVTVGATQLAGNATGYSPGFIGSDGVNAVIVGNAFDETDGLVFNGNPKNPWFGPDVVMAQFTLPSGNGFHLEGTVGWAFGAGAGFEATPFLVDVFPTPSPWDIDGSGTVGANDLLALLFTWGPCDDCFDCPADFDFNCNVGASDLLALLANWGPCP